MKKPLPPRPNWDQLRRQAKELLSELRAQSSKALRRFREEHPDFRSARTEKQAPAAWALHHAQLTLAREYGFPSWAKLKHEVLKRNKPLSTEALIDEARALKQAFEKRAPEAFSRIRRHLERLAYYEKEALANAFFTLGDALEVVARERGFLSWGNLLDHRETPGAPEFEKAVEAVIHGDAARLQQLLQQRPSLVKETSTCAHRATLLHYVAANGVEDSRQRTPPNAVQIAEMLLHHGADPDAVCRSYTGGRGQTPLALLVSSVHPHQAGLTGQLVEVLCRHGANPNGLDNDGHPLATAAAFGITPAVDALVQCGAAADHVILAAAAGRLDWLKGMVDHRGKLRSTSSKLSSPSIQSSADAGRALEQALFYACRNRRTAAASYLLSLGVSPNAPQNENQTGLHWAAYEGWMDLVQILVGHGAKARIRDQRWKCSAIGWALEGKHREIANYLLNHAQPGLLDCVEQQRADLVRKILEEASEPADGADGQGAPLRAAVAAGDISLVLLLLDHGANPNLSGPEGKTALHWAAEKNFGEIAEALIHAGASPARKTSWNMTALDWAANMGSKEAGQALLQRGEAHSLWTAAGLGQTETVRAFLRQKPDATSLSKAFYIACRNGHLETARLLLPQGADIDFRGFFGATGLHWAAINGHRAVVEFLIEQGADLSLCDEKFRASPAEWAHEGKHADLANLLLEHGTPTSLRDAAAFGRADLVKRWLDEDASMVNFNDGRTALHAAVEHEHEEVVALLLSSGADPNLPDAQGQTASDLARSKNHSGLLRQLGAA